MAQKQKKADGHRLWSNSIGPVVASVFENAKNGSVWHNVSVSRSYSNGGEPEYTPSFRHQDLMNVRRLLNQAYNVIEERKRELRAASAE